LLQTDVKKPTVAAAQTGASIVDQEIQRQRERDTQLRAERELLATATLLSPSSSPALTPMASAADRRPAKVVDAERLIKRRTFDGESSFLQEMDEHRQREEELRQQRGTTTDINGHTDSRTSAGHVDKKVRHVGSALSVCCYTFCQLLGCVDCMKCRLLLPMCAVSVSLSFCHATQLGFIVQGSFGAAFAKSLWPLV